MSTYGNNLLAQYYAQSGGILPSEYRQVEYLESTGAQYIDTLDVVASSLSAMYLEFSIDEKFSFSSSSFLFGSGYESLYNGTTKFSCSLDAQNSIRVPSGSNFVSLNVNTINYNEKHRLEYSFGVIKMDGVIVGNAEYQYFAQSEVSTWLFGRHGMPPVVSYIVGAGLRVHKCKSMLGETLVRSYIPCVRKSDNKPGMYDLCRSICPLTGTPFYINAGTGEFVTP